MRDHATVFALSIATVLGTGVARARELDFADRLKCQEAIERFYYAHQIGATRRFEEALPTSVLRSKVLTYLKQSEALRAAWGTPVTADMLQRETERMVRRTRMPERLRGLFAALGNDAFLVQECLARPSLVGRLTRDFFAFDERFHAPAREEAGRLRGEVLRLGVEAFVEDPRRSEMELVEIDRSGGGMPDRGLGSGAIGVSADDYRRRRAAAPERVGDIGPVQEERDAFVIRVVLDEAPGRARIASFAVRKRPWDHWWSEASPAFDAWSVAPVASAESVLPLPASISSASCLPDDTWDNGSLDDLPDPRVRHSAVWTGREMIVWGGISNNYMSTGGRYDPVIDTWSPTSMTGTPSARYGHTAIWTGAAMIVWGGEGGGNTGGRYDPETDSWTPTSTTGAPAGRVSHTVVWTGGEMVVWGGSGGFFVHLNSGGRYDPASDAWTPTSTTDAPIGRYGHTAVWTGSEMVIWGGSGSGSPRALNTGGRYDTATDTWTPISVGDAPTGRFEHTAVWTGDRMVVWGGSDGSAVQSTGGRYDPATNAWTPTSTAGAPASRNGHTAVWTGDQMVVWGGWIGGTALGTGGRYDPAADTWTATASSGAPTARAGHRAVWTGRLMIVWGGSPSNHTGGRYDPEADAWTPTSTLEIPSGRSSHAAVWTGSVMVVWGGFFGAVLDTGARYDPATDSWTPTSTTGAPVGHYLHTAVWSGEVMIVWGGKNYMVFLSNAGGRYDPATDTWAPISTSGAPTGRSFHTAVWTGQVMVVWGGSDNVGNSNTGGRYDPKTDTWAPTSTTGAPEPRALHTAIWTGTMMVVWAGSGGGLLNTGGRYDPVADTWTPTSTTGAPTARQSPTAVWTGSAMVVWGGLDIFFDSGTGGRYDPARDTWLPTSTSGAPTARRSHTAVWTGSVMIIWGGRIESGLTFSTGARYDPARDAWAPTSTTGAPPARSGHTAVWTGGLMIVWGGSLSSGGRYALGHEVDNDGDGLSECSGDCNDGNPAILPGAAEVCDGLDNDCDGVADNATVPSGIPSLAMELSEGTALLRWSPVSQATGYDLVRGDLSILHRTAGDFASATEACLANDLSETFFALSVDPSSDSSFWYLVRPINCGGDGVYDSGGPGQVGSRDAGIEASTSSCP